MKTERCGQSFDAQMFRIKTAFPQRADKGAEHSAVGERDGNTHPQRMRAGEKTHGKSGQPPVPFAQREERTAIPV